MANTIMVKSLIERSSIAQKAIENYTQQQVDAIVRMFAKVVYDNAEMLAEMAVNETRMGVLDHKIAKNKGKARIIWNDLKTKKSVGVLSVDEEQGLTSIARPMGVVVAVTPCTNPIVTPMCNAMFAIKCRNSIIIAPHPRAFNCANKLAELFGDELQKLGAPRDLFLVAGEASVDTTTELMQSADVVLATGGMGMVKAAYSSGKPSYGVGAGNVQCILDRGVDYTTAAEKILSGRCFDNGIICSGEQTVIAPSEEYKNIIERFVSLGVYYTEDENEVDNIRAVLFPNGVMNKDLVGQPVAKLLDLAGIKTSDNNAVKAVMVKPKSYGEGELFSKEKMCPVFSAYSYDSFEEAVAIACANLEVEGKGHSVAIHSNNKENLEYAGIKLPVSRVLVNQSCATMNGGAFANALTPTTTLGCGSWGNNSISENLSYKHLMNVTRIACEKLNWVQPTDDEIWSEG